TFRLVIIFSCLKSNSAALTTTFSGCPQRDRSFLPAPYLLRICNLGLATRFWIRPGSELEPTLLVAIRRRLLMGRSRLRESRRIPAPRLCCWVRLWLRWRG